ncbi:MAG: hypothetical protein ABS882_11255 [Lysinibacillus sp.]
MTRKFFSCLLITVILLSIILPQVSVEANTNKVTGSFILPDNPPKPLIGSNPARYKKDVDLLLDMLVDEGKSINHTGWSAKVFYWSEEKVEREDGTFSHWVSLPATNTKNGYIDENDYRAKDFTAEQLGVSEEVYEKMLEENTAINITVDSREDTERQVYSASVFPTQAEINAMLKKGETPYAFLYYDNDIKLNFEFELEDCVGDGCEPPPPPPPPIPPSDRTEIVYVPPTWGSGTVSWGMFKDTLKESGSSETKILWVNGLATGQHYAKAGVVKKMSGVANSLSNSVDLKAGKKGTETYSLTYDYTDYRIDYYKCTSWSPITDGEGNIIGWSCNGWTKVGEAPSWAHIKSYSCSVDLAVDHRYGETFEGKHGFKQKMNIGRSATVSAKDCKSTEATPNTETITHESSPVELPTQTYMSFMEQPIKWEGKPMYNTANISLTLKTTKDNPYSTPLLNIWVGPNPTPYFLCK